MACRKTVQTQPNSLGIPFGEVLLDETNRNWNTPWLFNGKELDEETGYYYYGARYYNPKVSNWLSVDPIALYDPVGETEHYLDGEHNGGYFNPRNMSVYGYTYQNPIIYVDPNGKQAKAGLINGKKAIEIRLNVIHSEKVSEDDVKQALIDASNVLSQNDYVVKIIDDENATINLEIIDKPFKSSSDKKANGDAGVIGDTQGRKDVPIKAILNIRTIAHEIAHRMGLRHTFDKNAQVENNSKTKYNLMNSGGNNKTELKSNNGIKLEKNQSDIMYNEIKQDRKYIRNNIRTQ